MVHIEKPLDSGKNTGNVDAGIVEPIEIPAVDNTEMPRVDNNEKPI